jgi:integrase
MRTKLTTHFIASAAAEAGAERTIHWDADLPGFGLQITSSGHKSYVVQYRHLGESRRMAISANLRLAEARKQAKAILGEVAKGHDVLEERRQKEAAAENTLTNVCENFFKRNKHLRSMPEQQRQLRRLIFPALGSKQLGDVKRSDLVRLLDKIEDQNGASTADHCLSYLSRVFSWQASRSDDFRSPIVRGMKRLNGNHARTRILTDDEIRKIWSATSNIKSAFDPLVRFLLLTATRRNEAAQMRRSELDGDVWVVPGARYKTGHDHVVPLSKAAQQIVAAMPVIDGGDFVFTNDGRRAAGGFSKFKARLDAESGTTGWTLHDLRRTARSIMSRIGISSDHAERCLGHVIGGVRGIYDRHAFLDEKRIAFEALAAEIDAIVRGKR